MISRNMTTRISVAAVAIPTAFFLIYLGGWALTALISLLAVVGTVEFAGLVEARGTEPLKLPAMLGAAGIPVLVLLHVRGAVDPGWLALGVVAWIILTVVIAIIRGPRRTPLNAVSHAIFAAAYTGGLSSAIIVLRHGPDTSGPLAATWLVLLPLVLTWVCDSVAMSFGGWIGGPRLASVISPNKTWSGAISGALSAAVLAPVYDRLVLDRFGIEIDLTTLLTIGLVVGILGQMGDLAESLFKRESGIKDSGNFFPGHGGVLDRMDSLYWVLPSTVIVFKYFGVL